MLSTSDLGYYVPSTLQKSNRMMRYYKVADFDNFRLFKEVISATDYDVFMLRKVLTILVYK